MGDGQFSRVLETPSEDPSLGDASDTPRKISTLSRFHPECLKILFEGAEMPLGTQCTLNVASEWVPWSLGVPTFSRWLTPVRYRRGQGSVLRSGWGTGGWIRSA